MRSNYEIITEDYGIKCHNRAGDQKAVCPKCSDDRKKKRDPSLYINIDKGVWKCYNPGCEWENGHGIQRTMQTSKRTYSKPEGTALTLDDKVKNHFQDNRAISPGTVEKFKVTAGDVYMPQVQKEVMAIHFNYYRNGELVNIKYKDARKNFKMVSGAELIFYGMDLTTSDDYIIICEGEEDAMSWHEAGLQAVSVPNGALGPGSTQRLEYLDNCYDWISRFKRIYLATDADAPGQNLAEELSRRLGRERCYLVRYPEGIKDANDAIRAYNTSVLKELFYAAEPYPLEAVLSVDNVYDSLLRELDTGLTPGVRLSSMEDFSEIQSWRPGELTLITGIPGHGKSSFVDNIIVSLAREHEWVIGVWSAEKPKVERHIAELYQIFLEKSFYLTNFDTQRINKIDIDTHRQFFEDHFKFIDTGTADLTMDGLLAKGRELVGRFGIKMLVLDNWATIEHSHSGKKSKHDYSGEALSKMFKWCKINQCDIVLVAHPNKDVKRSDGKLRPPNGYDVSDSSHFYNLVDNGLTVYRNYETGLTDVIKWKNRWKELGNIGQCHFTYNTMTGKFKQAEAVNTGQSQQHFIGQTIKDAKKYSGI